MVVQLKNSHHELGSLLFGSSSVAKLLMLEHKDVVADALLALVESAKETEAEGEARFDS